MSLAQNVFIAMTQWNREIALYVGFFAYIIFVFQAILFLADLSPEPLWRRLIYAMVIVGSGALWFWARLSSSTK
jgi:uncharacterized membrane protein